MKCKKKSEKHKTFKWYLNRILIGIMRLIPVLAIALLVKSVNDDNKIMLYISFAIFPLMGIFITPNVIIYAIKDSKKDESKFLSKMNRLDKRFVITEDKERYHLKILFA